MRADAAAQLRLLDLQALDTVLGQLAHRRRGVPQIAELAALDGRAQELRDHEVAVRTAVSDLEREMAKAEADVAQVRERITRDQALLDAGRWPRPASSRTSSTRSATWPGGSATSRTPSSR